jgi:O-antigen/teichoic acid export membrane protein
VYTWLARAEIFARDVTRLGRRDRQAFVRFSGIMCFAVLIDAVIWGRPELIFLARYRPQADLGLYSAALRLASIATIVPIVASRALLPEFARLRGADDHDGLAHVYPRVCRLLAVIAAPLALGGAAVAAPLVGIMYGHRYDGAATTAALLLAGSLVNALTGPASAAVLTGPRPRLVAELGSIAAVVNIVADFVLIPRYGIVGAAGINVVIQAASVATGITYSWWKLGLRYPVRPVVRIIAIAGIAALGAGFVARAEPGWPGLIIGTLVAVALYAGLLAGTKTVTGDELSGLVRSWRRGGDSDGSGSEVQQAQSTNRSLSTRRVDQ